MKAQKTIGLLTMLLPALLLSVGPYLVGGAYWLSTIGGILLVATGAAWRWPLLGGSIGIGVSILPLIISIGLIITNYEMTLIYGLIGLVPSLMFLTGSILVFTSARKAGGSVDKLSRLWDRFLTWLWWPPEWRNPEEGSEPGQVPGQSHLSRLNKERG